MSWLAQTQVHKVIIGLLAADHLYDRITDLWHKYKPVEEFVERRLNDRRSHMNFVSGLLLAESEAVKISAFLAKLPTYLPLIQQNIADLQKAATDKSNPAALMGDVSNLLNDLNTDLSTLTSVLPALAPNAPTPPPPATPAA